MAVQVYTFKVTYKHCEGKIWRIFDVSSNSDLALLGYMILASFDTMAYHLFSIECNNTIYETAIENYGEYPLLQETKLSELGLKIGPTGHNHVHAHTGPDGKVYYHTHEEHVHEAEAHEHHHEPEGGKTVTLGQAILAENDHIAAHNRAWFAQRGLRVFNLISSPGSGKTTLLVKTLERLKSKSNTPCPTA